MTLDDINAIDEMLPRIENAAGRRSISPITGVAMPQPSRCFDVERFTMSMILTLIIVVAALNIISGLYMLVRDEIARHRH